MMSANAEIGVAVANFFPRIGLTALYGGESAEIDNVIKNNFSIWNIAGSVSGPIFQGGRLLEQYRARQAFWDETIAAYRGTIVQALREVSDALAAQSKLVERRAAEERQVKALAPAVELSLIRYRTGLASYFEVLEARAAALSGRGCARAVAARPAPHGRRPLQGARRRLEPR